MRQSKTTNGLRFWFALVVLLSCGICSRLSAQHEDNVAYNNLNDDQQFKTFIANQNEINAGHIKEQYKGKLRKYLLTQFTDYNAFFDKMVTDGELVEAQYFGPNTVKIANKILHANNIGDEVVIACSQDPWLNAYCMHNGVIVFNLGLYYYLDSEAQVAAVLAHELAHKILEHPLQSYVHQYNENENLSDEIKNIKRERYTKRNQALNLLRQKVYGKGKLRRSQEIQADSLGFVLFEKANYDPAEYVNALGTFIAYDTVKPEGITKEDFHQWLSTPSMKFNETWLASEGKNNYIYHEEETLFHEDSISTHPETEERISALKSYFPGHFGDTTSKHTVDSAYYRLQRLAQQEQMTGFEQMENYGFGLYLCLYRLKQHPESDYYQSWLGRFMGLIRDARKAYTMNRYVEHVNKDNDDEGYNQLLTILWNMEYSELDTLANYHMNQ